MANEILFFLHATFTIFWLNIAFIAVHSGERCGPWASGSKGPLCLERGIIQSNIHRIV